MLKKINALVATTLILSACSNPSVTPNEPNHSATGGDPLPSGTVLIDPKNPSSPPSRMPSTSASAPVISNVSVPSSSAGKTHRVVRGETLFSLAKRYRVSVQALMSWNHLSSPSALKVGQTLRIHASSGGRVQVTKRSSKSSNTYHRVRGGETLYSVARHYRQSVGNLAKWNGLRKSARLKVGQKLRVRP